ncbi:Anaerobic C4-dicarboxylate transporter [Bibersteinia trehalosi USDA-ARS-USMARC-188]|uniref:C4-dicarboxylate transporter n=3 Tax=Bibersteinia trehalosi TaxID=47735 RepID=W0R618_BIBTR|nr:anaerobic C4-dicarboxylate transporter [Bibersteinia trehalosi]AGH37735.1 Anaerobic C4-dicarboxylate transporter [Bibersteinia trehalosi USDA-ARS-USMARC-192]AHG82465.1 Anaerobic C4-dicarboxylate transporter [Bibersteinia trehalosi USDA-ARS-USMARC-188]AHG84786.1 Anaerobic C4-dicarboxylate transporter [Bibersteinia trehalosi USDA-ARS-USMARC-189]AHG85715.1 Anaerobic C4-dicarboxylate transporter [Bibersteinia trehalosi USDA-ARS-USMARC-190]TCT15167.1 anaerobic C4-dicarboxylate transporter DcuB [
MLYLEFLFLLVMLYIGSRYGGIGLGVVSGIGLAIEVFILRMPLGKAPVDVMLIILAVVTCASILEAAGGLKFMLQVAEKVLRKNPKRITFLGPLVTYIMTFMLGTGHSVYSVMPIIADVALKNKIRPERPMAAASVASQLAITSSPLSAAVVYYLGQISGLPGFEHVSLLSIIGVTVPATLAGTIAMSLYSLRRGKELENDPEYQRRLQDPVWRDRIANTTSTTLNDTLPAGAKQAVYLFLLALVVIVAIAMFPEIRTVGEGEKVKPIGMSLIIQIMMLCFGGLILILTRTNPQTVPNGVVFKSGMVAAIAIFGIAWMSDTYFQYAMPQFKAGITEMVENYPWTFAFALFAVSVVINSQAATAVMMLPVGIGLGLPAPLLVGLMPATYGYFFIPNYPSDIATVNFDVTGTTKIGKYYFNHSFMAPGIIGVVTACVVGIAIANVLI